MLVDFKSTLLREKFVLHDGTVDGSGTQPFVALSNRMVVPLRGGPGGEHETYVIRTQNMHSCAGFAAIIAREYALGGPLMTRGWKFDWAPLWADMIRDHEKDANPEIWCAVYFQGKPVFGFGQRHPFFDIIEKCDTMNNENYAESVRFAEESFQQSNKNFKIEYTSNIAMILTMDSGQEAKCGLIVRGSNRKTTFNFIIRQRPLLEPVYASEVLMICSAFFEGIQLAFNIGMTHHKLELEIYKKFSTEDKAGKKNMERMIVLDKMIQDFEQAYSVQYRPDRPDFFKIVKESEDFAASILKS